MTDASNPSSSAVTRFAGSFGPLMAEYVVGHVIAHQRQFFGLLEVTGRWLLRVGFCMLAVIFCSFCKYSFFAFLEVSVQN